MKPIKNKSKPKWIYVDLFRDCLLKCYKCGRGMGTSTTLMHHGCWDATPREIQDQAERDLNYAIRNEYGRVQKGQGGL
jgi:hypothetical protein